MEIKTYFWMDLLIHLRMGENFSLNTAREMNITFSHVNTTVSALTDLGLIQRRKDGRCNYISLTESGSKIAKHLAQIVEELQDNEDKNTKKRKSKSKTKQSK